MTDPGRAFGVSAQHAGRLVRGDQRGDVMPSDPLEEPELGPVGQAVDGYLGGTALDRRGQVLAATARAVASKLDHATASGSTAIRNGAEEASNHPRPRDRIEACCFDLGCRFCPAPRRWSRPGGELTRFEAVGRVA